MNSLDNANRFFHACEGLEGWQGCQQYVAKDAEFVAQSEPLIAIKSVQDYCDWLADIGSGPLAGCDYELHTCSYDEDKHTVIFFATFIATHTAAGGPVSVTQRSTNSHYVYVLRMDAHGRVEHMTKIWNAPWAFRELGWA